MNSREARSGGKRQVQRRNVAKADEQLRVSSDYAKIQIGQDASRPPAAANCKDCSDTVVRIHGVDIGCPVPVASGEIAKTRQHMGRWFGDEAHRGHGFHDHLKLKLVSQKTRRLD